MSDIYIYMSEQDREVALITNLAFITRITTLVKPNQKVSCMRNKKSWRFQRKNTELPTDHSIKGRSTFDNICPPPPPRSWSSLFV